MIPVEECWRVVNTAQGHCSLRAEDNRIVTSTPAIMTRTSSFDDARRLVGIIHIFVQKSIFYFFK